MQGQTRASALIWADTRVRPYTMLRDLDAIGFVVILTTMGEGGICFFQRGDKFGAN